MVIITITAPAAAAAAFNVLRLSHKVFYHISGLKFVSNKNILLSGSYERFTFIETLCARSNISRKSIGVSVFLVLRQFTE